MTLREFLPVIGEGETIKISIDPKYDNKGSTKTYETPIKKDIEGMDMEITEVFARKSVIYIDIGYKSGKEPTFYPR